MTAPQIAAIAERLDAIDDRLATIEHSRDLEREVARKLARASDANLRTWARRASIAAVVGPIATFAAAVLALTVGGGS